MKYLREVLKDIPHGTHVIFKSEKPLEAIASAPHIRNTSKLLEAGVWHRAVVDTQHGRWLWVIDNEDGIVTSMRGLNSRVRLVYEVVEKFMVIKYVGDKK